MKWINIDFKDGEFCYYAPSEYTEYQYDGKYFIVIKDEQWIGFYNLDEVRCIKIVAEKEPKKSANYTFYEEKK